MAAVARVGVELTTTKAVQEANKLKAAVQRLSTQAPKATNSVQAVGNAAQRTGRQAASATANIQRFGVAFRSVIAPIVAVTASVNFLGKSLKVFGERQADTAALAAGLARLGKGSDELERLAKIADKLGKQTLFDEEDFVKGFKLLSTFKNIGTESYERVAVAAADLSEDLGTNLNSTFLQLAKALEDPVRGLTALSRSGTTFNEQQKTQIKTLVESGRQAQAFEEILRAVEGQVKNSAKAAGSAGFAGAMDTLGENFREFQSVVGEKAEPAATAFVTALSNMFKNLAKVNPQLIDAVGQFGKLAISLGIVVGAYKALKTAIAAAAAAKAFLLTLTGVGLLKVLAAGVAAKVVYDKLGESVQEAATTLKTQREQTEGLNGNSAKSNALAEKRKQILQAQTQSLNNQAAALGKQVNAESIRLKRDTAFGQARNKVYQEQISAELKINRLAIQRAKQKGNTFAVLQLELRQVELVYQQTVAQVKAEAERARLKVRQVEIETKELEIANLRKKAEGKLQEADKQALALQKQVLGIAKFNVKVAAQVAEQQIRGAQATAIASKEALRFAYSQERAAQAANRTANAVARTARAAGGGGSRAGDTEEDFGTYKPVSAMDRFMSRDVYGRPIKRYATDRPGSFTLTPMAEGGYVTRPTNALIGEAGENEYVIPESRMGSAIRRYTRGARGESVVEGSGETSAAGRKRSGAVVNISTGPVMRMDDQDYVTVSDLNEAVGSVAVAMSSGSEVYGGSTRLS